MSSLDTPMSQLATTLDDLAIEVHQLAYTGTNEKEQILLNIASRMRSHAKALRQVAMRPGASL